METLTNFLIEEGLKKRTEHVTHKHIAFMTTKVKYKKVA
jgi:hypothetical protein